MHGVSLITFPVDSADLLDIYSSTDILKLMQVFVDLCAGDVAVVADLKHGWTEDCIEKLTYLLDELQVDYYERTERFIFFGIHTKKAKYAFQE